MDLEAIKRDCKRRMQRTLQKTHSDANDIIDSSFNQFYAQGNPKRLRTHTLPGSSYISNPSYNGDHCEFEAGYEGDQISYADGTFSGGEVLGATMTGTYGVLGDPTYDEKAFEDIINTADANFASEFGNG